MGDTVGYHEKLIQYKTIAGPIDLYYMFEKGITTLDIYANEARFYVPPKWELLSPEIVRNRVIKTILTGQKLGINKGIYKKI